MQNLGPHARTTQSEYAFLRECLGEECTQQGLRSTTLEGILAWRVNLPRVPTFLGYTWARKQPPYLMSKENGNFPFWRGCPCSLDKAPSQAKHCVLHCPAETPALPWILFKSQKPRYILSIHTLRLGSIPPYTYHQLPGVLRDVR